MAINREHARQWLKAFDFKSLFIEELGWDNLATNLVKQIDGADYRFHAVAEKRGVVVLISDTIPEYAVRVKLDKLIAKDHFEHLIVFTDQPHGRQVWQWVRKEPGKPTAVRTYHYSPAQSGELLFQKLDSLVFTLDEEEILTLTSVTGRLKAFDVEKVTKKFYERFKTEHSSFLSFIKGIPDKQMESGCLLQRFSLPTLLPGLCPQKGGAFSRRQQTARRNPVSERRSLSATRD